MLDRQINSNLPGQTSTCTALELIQHLHSLISVHGGDLLVAFTWEGQILPVVRERIILDTLGKNREGKTVILLDAET